MRRATAWVVVVGVAILGTSASAMAADGFWVSIASGAAGSATPTDYREAWFDSPHAPPSVAVTRFTGGTAEATTGGGSSFFSGGAVPVVLNTTDGYAYLAGGAKPSDLSQALRRQTSGGQGLATATPDATATAPPPNSLRLTVDVGDPDPLGARSLSVSLLDGMETSLGNYDVSIPEGGWWVIGLGPGMSDIVIPDPNPIGGGGGTGGGNTGGGAEPEPGGNTGGNTGGGGTGGGGEPLPTTGGPGPVATPEPATGLLLGIGALTAAGWRSVRRRRK